MTDTTESTPLQDLIRELALHMDATFVPRSQTDNAATTKLHEMQIHWKVRIYRENRSADITTSYGMGIGHLPKAVKVPVSHASADQFSATIKTLETGRYYSRGGQLSALPSPSIADVLYALVQDSEVMDYGSFEDWAANLGFDADSRKAESIYRACLDIGLKLRRMLSDAELTKLREAFQDY